MVNEQDLEDSASLSDFSTDSELRELFEESAADSSISGLTDLSSEIESDDAQSAPLDLAFKVKEAPTVSSHVVDDRVVIAELSPIRMSLNVKESDGSFAAGSNALAESSQKTIENMLSANDSEHGLVRVFQETIERDISKVRESVAEMYEYLWHPERHENRDKIMTHTLVNIDNTLLYIATLTEKMKERLQRKRVRTSTPIPDEPACKRVLRF